MLGANRLSFKPMSGFPSVGLHVGASPWQITSGKWYYEVTLVKTTDGVAQARERN